MYKRSVIWFFVLCVLASATALQAQSPAIKWAAGLGGGVIQYQQKAKSPAFQYSFYDPVVLVSASRYLVGAFDFHTEFAYSPRVHFPVSVEQSRLSAFYDMNYQLRFKLNNGLFFRENAFIGPYLSFGIGGSYTQNNPDVYVPLGGGVRFRLSKRANINVQSIRKFSVNKDYQNIAHIISFVYNIGQEQLGAPADVPEELTDEQIVALLPADDDGDGIVNLQDECPDEPGLLTHNGCPAEADAPQEVMPTDQSVETPAPVLVDLQQAETETTEMNLDVLQPHEAEVPVIKPEPALAENLSPVDQGPCSQYAMDQLPPVHFQLNSDQLNEEAKAALDQVAGMMKSCPSIRLVVRGHADASGTDERNLILSVMRAYRVKYYLVYEHGLSQMRINSGGLGENQPVASNDTPEGRELNRRVDFQLVF
ncbi:MAG: OmpA family protein [Bacteroidetes bacterium]|nr:MAG: OmpA family protein [Bacteroidota bacterium]